MKNAVLLIMLLIFTSCNYTGIKSTLAQMSGKVVILDSLTPIFLGKEMSGDGLTRMDRDPVLSEFAVSVGLNPSDSVCIEGRSIYGVSSYPAGRLYRYDIPERWSFPKVCEIIEEFL